MNDLTNRRFGRLIAVRATNERRGRQVIWLCKCECGNTIRTHAYSLRQGFTQSCGCLKKERFAAAGPASRKHGHSGNHRQKIWPTPTYRSWKHMWRRCTNPNDIRFSIYGGRGIKVCRRWKRFEHFLTDVGLRPKGKTLDRINPNGNYTPKNVRWATPKEQARNRRELLQ